MYNTLNRMLTRHISFNCLHKFIASSHKIIQSFTIYSHYIFTDKLANTYKISIIRNMPRVTK